MIHIPRGEMCIGCTKALDKCNHLAFDKMKPLTKKPDNEGYMEVKCIEFRRKGEVGT